MFSNTRTHTHTIPTLYAVLLFLKEMLTEILWWHIHNNFVMRFISYRLIIAIQDDNLTCYVLILVKIDGMTKRKSHQQRLSVARNRIFYLFYFSTTQIHLTEQTHILIPSFHC